MKIDFLVIGQGLAGSLLAWELIQRNKKVVIVDNGEENASLVAAGLINPVTGMRFVKSKDVDHLLPTAIQYYKTLSDYFQHSFYMEKTMLRVLHTPEDLVACQKRLKQTDYQHYLEKIIRTSPFIKNTSGILVQKQTGFLLTRSLLTYLKEYFISRNSYLNTEFNYNDIEFTPDLKWKNYQPAHIIFCEGHTATINPWFSWLPFRPVKGEILTADASVTIPQKIINYGHWFIPLGAYQFRTGATFDRVNLDTVTTEKAKSILLDSLHQACPHLTLAPGITQQAGIRPTTQDKQPFIGKLPNQPELAIFNGFGAKGSLQIPWYAKCFADHLINQTPIAEHSSIQRFCNLP